MDVSEIFKLVTDQAGILSGLLVIAVVVLFRRDIKREEESKQITHKVIELTAHYEAMIQQYKLEKNQGIDENRKKLSKIISEIKETKAMVSRIKNRSDE